MTAHLYPHHIYDPRRRHIARQLIEKEFDKHGIPAAHATNLLNKEDEHYFWNAVEAILGGLLFKPLVDRLTASNFEWSQQQVAIADIRLSSKLDQLHKLPGLEPNKLFLKDIHAYLLKHPQAAEEQAHLIHKRTGKQNDYPIIAVRNATNVTVLDGNRRALLSLLQGKSTIYAWVYNSPDQPPKDFWFPIDDMFRLVATYKRTPTPEMRQVCQTFLRTLFAQSKVAKIAYKERVVAMGTAGAADIMP